MIDPHTQQLLNWGGMFVGTLLVFQAILYWIIRKQTRTQLGDKKQPKRG